ncbi:hypothetical protein F444_16023 [Phytophthora nicotianae P1976]|uniref:Uncharacterized protein n=1 Tax=Phytophthora nicotianae P1976 TaxID=1317066 RepID=A0A080ZJX3_PHYNI|nr:hypothetical protein F444_16023 [Phytophthora nicotianae P1976]
MLEDRIRSEAFYEMALQPWPFQLDTTLNFVRGGVQEAEQGDRGVRPTS